jgi:hypothetical protein
MAIPASTVWNAAAVTLRAARASKRQHATGTRNIRLVVESVCIVVVLAASLTGCGGSLEPYETEDGPATRLDGTEHTAQVLAPSDALRLHPQQPVYVRGYLLAPPDDVDRLCTQVEKGGVCGGAYLIVDTSRVDSYASPALEAGCCALGLWSPHPLVLRLRVERGRRAVVLG